MSVSNDIASCAVALGALAGQVNEEQWAVVRVVRQNLQAHAEQVQHMENGLCVMPDGTLHVGGRRARIIKFPAARSDRGE